jgi:uncharacterized protein
MGGAGTIWPTWLHRQDWRVSPKAWPAGRTLRIAVLADPHAGGPQMPSTRLWQAVAAITSIGADLIAVMGDYLADHRFVTSTVPMAEVARAIATLRAPLGVYAVMGNHDWRADPEAQHRMQGPTIYARTLADAGVTVLENEGRRIGIGAESLWVLGLGTQQVRRATRRSGWEGVDDLPATLAALTDDAPAILLAHEPDIFPDVPPRVALTIAGHTHGGQIIFGRWIPVVPSRYRARYAWGHIHEDGRHLVVSGGLGCSGLPVRFGRRPEVTVITLSQDAS